MNRTISCVLFDLDNTLTDRAASLYLFAQRFFEDFQGMLQKQVAFDDIHHVMQIGDGGGYRPKEVMFQEIQTALPWVEAPTIETVGEYWYRVSAECMQLRPGVQKTLEELQHRGYTLGMITNGKTVVQNATIDAIHIRDYFSTIIISEESGFRKPDPRIFHLALSRLQIPPEGAVYVGDHPEADIQGAGNAGLETIWFAGLHTWQDVLTPPQYQITEIPQLLELLP